MTITVEDLAASLGVDPGDVRVILGQHAAADPDGAERIYVAAGGISDEAAADVRLTLSPMSERAVPDEDQEPREIP